MNSHDDKIWAYLHDELTPDDKASFEQQLKNDSELSEALESRRLIHNDMEHLLPVLTEDDPDDEALEAQLLEEWESEHPQFQETERQRAPNRTLRLLVPLAAAAVLLIIALPWRSSPIDWQRTVFGEAPQLRGQPELQAHYNNSDLKGIDRALRLAIETEVKNRPQPVNPWKLKIHIQEMAAGAIMIELSGHPVGLPEDSKVWNLNFEDFESCINKLPEAGKQVAGEL